MRAIPVLIAAYLALLAACSPAHTGGHAVTASDGTQWHPLTVERLPDLNAPRGSHRTVVIGDEILLLGGQTDGFKPVETSEYYANGAWHTIPMLYPHINGFAAPLPDGRILLGGGSAEAFGIGQSWGAEIYDPATHTFQAAGILSAKRAMSVALTRPDGSVVILGNWRAADSWEIWSPETGFVSGGSLTPGWAEPFLFPAGEEDIIVFGLWDPYSGSVCGRVDHLGGATEEIPLLEEWVPVENYYVFPEDLQIADYTYLVPVLNRTTGASAILKVASGSFSLLETESPIPATDPDGNPIQWGPLQVDRPARLAWMQGISSITGSLCIARIGYDATFDGGKASVTLYYASRPGGYPCGCAQLMPGGRFILAGGRGLKEGTFPVEVDNFKAYSTVYIFHTEAPLKGDMPLWAILMMALLAGGVAVLAIVLVRRGRRAAEKPAEAEESRLNLMEQLSALIEEKELYRRKNLRITDVASELATNKTYVSVLLNNLSGESFTTMITRYRVQYAQKLLREHPEMLLDEVAESSGFSSRTTFFRSFKALTGQTPQEWRKSRR